MGLMGGVFEGTKRTLATQLPVVLTDAANLAILLGEGAETMGQHGFRGDRVRYFTNVVHAASGMSANELLTRAGLGDRTLPDISGRMSARDHYELWSVAADCAQAFPVQMAQGLSLSDLGAFGTAVASSGTLRRALEIAFQAYSILNTDGRWMAHVDGQSLIARWVGGAPCHKGAAVYRETVALDFVHQARQHTGLERVAQRVTFTHEAPRHRSALEEALGCEVRFSAPAVTLEFGADALEWTDDHYEAVRHHALLAQLQGELRRHPIGWSLAVRNAVDQIGAERIPTFATIARALGTSERSLHRKLKREGVRYQQVLDEAIYDSALKLLAEDGHSIASVAQRLGFSEHSAFTRAFRRVSTHETPAQVRKRLWSA